MVRSETALAFFFVEGNLSLLDIGCNDAVIIFYKIIFYRKTLGLLIIFGIRLKFQIVEHLLREDLAQSLESNCNRSTLHINSFTNFTEDKRVLDKKNVGQ